MAITDPPEVHDRLWSGWPGGRGFDVGARCGESLGDFLEAGFTSIDCFEPSEPAFAVLDMIPIRPGTSVNKTAVSDHDGSVVLYVTEAMYKGELVSPVDGMEWSVPDWGKAITQTVPCITLDTWCAVKKYRPDLVKIDTEGHEVRVLAGARQLLEHGCGWIIEFHSPANRFDCQMMLQQTGYRIEIIRNPTYMKNSPMWRQHGWIRAEKRA